MSLPLIFPQGSSVSHLQITISPLEWVGETWLLTGWGRITVFLAFLNSGIILRQLLLTKQKVSC